MAPDDPPPPEPNDRKVKELLDGENSAADLEKWFGLPTFQQVDEGEVKLKPVAEEDPDMVAVRDRRAKAIAAVDPVWLERHRLRTDAPLDDLIKFKATITLRVNPDLPLFDRKMIENKMQIADERWTERPEDISEQMEENAPQALLRDLHRPELTYEKLFEVVDMAAEQKLDAVAEVLAAMATNWRLPELQIRPGVEARQLYGEVLAERRSPWADIPKRVNLPNRRITE
jgi:hypothetical protein